MDIFRTFGSRTLLGGAEVERQKQSEVKVVKICNIYTILSVYKQITNLYLCSRYASVIYSLNQIYNDQMYIFHNLYDREIAIVKSGMFTRRSPGLPVAV